MSLRDFGGSLYDSGEEDEDDELYDKELAEDDFDEGLGDAKQGLNEDS